MARAPFDQTVDYYQLLGVGPDASTEQIQAAYRRLAKAFHPDLNAGSTAAAARMARLNVAKSVLLDPEVRATYDQARGVRTLHARVVAAAAGQSIDGFTVRYAPYQSASRPRYRVVSSAAKRAATRGSFDKGTGVLLLIAVPLM